MLLQYIKMTVRVFLKNKLFTTINVLGLAIGITAYILISQYVAFESSYDQNHPRIEDLYRVTLTSNLGSKGFRTSAANHPAVAPAMKRDFPEVESYTRFVEKSIMWGTFVLSYTDDSGAQVKSNVNNDRLYIADSTAFDLFDIDLVKGNPKTALTEPSTIVLSKELAHRFFGKQNPIDKILKINKEYPMKVTGVFESLPENTHLKFDMLASFSTLGPWTQETWIWPEFYNYVRLKPGTDPQQIEAKFPSFTEKYLSDIMQEHSFQAEFGLQPVREIHLTSHHENEVEANASVNTLNFLRIIAALIILIALMNFINLSTSKSMERAMEVGIKKVAGIKKTVLIRQFLFESVAINFLSILIAIGLVTILTRPFNQLVGLNVLSLKMWLDPIIWVQLLGLMLLGGILAGIYPAFVLSSFKPAAVLKGKMHQTGKGALMRRTLIVAQFTISIVLITGTFIVYSQFDYMRNQDLGYDAEHNLVIHAPVVVVDSTITNEMEFFKQELLRDPKINAVTMTDEVPGRKMKWYNTARQSHEKKEESVICNLLSIDHDFVQTYKIPLLAGRNFRFEDRTSYGFSPRRDGNKTHRVLINREAVQTLGFVSINEAMHQKITFQFGTKDRTAEIVGILENYHQQSLQVKYEPFIFLYPDFYNAVYLTVNMNTDDIGNTLSNIGNEFESFFPNDPYTYFFLDEHFNQQYKAELRFGKICLWFAALAIFIAALGLFGLGSYLALKKTKELCMRKVLGANMMQVLMLIPKNLLSLVLLSGVIALPVAFFLAKEWLSNYAFQISINIWMFLIPVCAVIIIAAMSVLPDSLRVASVNPVKFLRNE